ncbi:MAG: lytic transglycosylase domain-containing protein [Parvibaculaceae bacterium]|nr:lytic transglycosylase domain-containing protein [Parvibaculaceae bacterium]
MVRQSNFHSTNTDLLATGRSSSEQPRRPAAKARVYSQSDELRLFIQVFCTSLIALAMLFVFLSPGVFASDVLPASSLSTSASPSLLSDQDKVLYRQIFAAQKRGKMSKARKLQKKLSNNVLMGHVLFERYLHPTAYRSSYKELKSWMGHYNDHPGANRIYKLALRKRRKGDAYPDKPVRRRYRASQISAYAVGALNTRTYSKSYRRAAKKVRRYLRRERPTQALNYISKKSVRRHLNKVEYDTLRARISGSYFIEQRDAKAYYLAAEVAQRSRVKVPLADWYAGLAAWRLDKFEIAAGHFDALARARHVSDWTRAAGGFWAARAYVASREPAKVAEMLEIAAHTGATFYGLLAAQQLGNEPRFNWISPSLSPAGLQLLMTEAAVPRAIALVEVGQRALAETELTRAHGRIDAGLDQSLIALAEALQLPATQLQVANSAYVPPAYDGAHTPGDAYVMNAALFPLPDYTPSEGFQIDRALLFAFMRQESKFKPGAKSGAGARGLMQIMPATATHITKDRSLKRRNKDKLYDPSFNLSLGQKYIKQMLSYGKPYGNLFMVTTAYNGGPGNLNRWRRETNFKDDPLLFIESIPAAETRGYIERVLTNFWMYRERLGQPTPSLTKAAEGDWPVYHPQEVQADYALQAR